jgi:all-trans-8'-apo-beta-carotenal 15,15'-oxygenase
MVSTGRQIISSPQTRHNAIQGNVGTPKILLMLLIGTTLSGSLTHAFHSPIAHTRLGRCHSLSSTALPAEEGFQVAQKNPSSETSSSPASPSPRRQEEPDMVAYAHGYKTVFTELACQACTPSVGSIPLDLQGTYYRAGPAMFSAGSIVPPKKSIVQPKQPPVPDGQDPTRMVLHPMEGDGALLGVTFRGTSTASNDIDSNDDSQNEETATTTNTPSTPFVTARYRLVRTVGFTAERKKGARLYTGMDKTRQSATSILANDLPLPLYRHHLQPGLNKLRKHTANTRAVYWGKRLVVLWEGGQPYKLDAMALSTEGRSRLGGAIPKETDPVGGKVVMDPVRQHALLYAVEPGPSHSQVVVYEFNEKFKLVDRTTTNIPGFAVLNDFAATTNYALFIQPNIQVNGMQYLLDKSPASALSLTPDASATLHIVRRLTPVDEPPLSIPLPFDGNMVDANVHFCNAYEVDTNTIVMDGIRSAPPPSTATSSSTTWPWGTNSLSDYQSRASKKSLWRYTIDVPSRSVTKQLLWNHHCLFGTVPTHRSTLPHPSIYLNVGALEDTVAPPQGVARFDCDTQTSDVWMPEPFEFCGEPMYAPRTLSSESTGTTRTTDCDDGYVLSVAFNGRSERSDMLIFDARSIAQGPITRIPLGMAIPHGYFGCFTNAEEASWSDDAIERRAKLADKMESQGNQWNVVKSDFSGLGLRLDDMEEYFGDWNPFA